MCGIAGEIGKKFKPQPKVWEAMRKSLAKRGSSSSGILTYNNVALIQTSLDFNSKISKPFTVKYGEKDFSIVCDGRLYNKEEIKAELRKRRHCLLGYSDTEIILSAYLEWGEDCVKKFNGVFAFVIYEKHNNRLFVARDHFGVKPFFYTRINGLFVFGSEIKSLLAHPLVDPILTTEELAEVVLLGPGRTPGKTPFYGIYELLPAYSGYYFVENNNLIMDAYWKLQDHPHTDNFSQTVEKTRSLVLNSIEKQLISDTPLGTFLSGGLDSSIISSIANSYIKKQGTPLTTFSVDYVDNDKHFTASKFQPNSDVSYIRKMNDFLSAKHIRILLDSDELAEGLFDAVDARDMPGMADVDSSLLLFSKQVKKHISVALSGECADEIFGGYPWFRDESIRNAYGFPWSQNIDYRASFLSDNLKDKINTHNFVFSRYKYTINNTDVLDGTNEVDKRIKQMHQLNYQWFMQTLLDRTDRMAMYNGLEVRVPFCDHSIIEYMYRVPWEYKNYENREKGLLRIAMQGLLPDNVLWRKKSPYPKTHNPNYLALVSKMLQEIIDNSLSPILQIINKTALENLLATATTNNFTIPWYGQLMTIPQTIAYFVQINYWLEKYKVKIKL
ncbi:MAG: asparagine synthase (glutamine-hydrolyzing) [Firmicutes bacterium]|nr:asparagine synthase (glutamine-hydrolyzing) [Bacillota bacterium]